MPPTGLAAVIKRRWYLALVGIIVTLGLCAVAFVAFPAQYQAKAVVLLLPPASASVSGSESAAGQNPYVSLGLVDGLNDVLAQAMTDSATGSALLSAGLDGSYTVENDPATSGPLILITGTAKSSSMAVAITNRIVALVPQTLLRLQQAAGVLDTKNNVTSTVLNPAGKTVKVRKNQERAVIAAGVVGIVLTLLITAAADKVLLGRRRRAAESAEAAVEAEADQVVAEVVAPIEDEQPVVIADEQPVVIADEQPVIEAALTAEDEPVIDEPEAETETDDTVEPAQLDAADEPVELAADEPAELAQDDVEDEPVAHEAAPAVEDEVATETETDASVEPAPHQAEDEAVEAVETVEPAEGDADADGAETPAPEDEATTSTAIDAESAEPESAEPESAEPELVAASAGRPEPTWRLRPGRNPGRERTISRNGRPQPRFDANQATMSPDEISRPV
jgi:capsular polysaccharide biosynthesis protein